MKDRVAMKDPRIVEDEKKYNLDYEKKVFRRYQKVTEWNSESSADSDGVDDGEIVTTATTKNGIAKTTQVTMRTKATVEDEDEKKWVKEVMKQLGFGRGGKEAESGFSVDHPSRVTDVSIQTPQHGSQDARIMAATRGRDVRKETRIRLYKDERIDKKNKVKQ
ncbi:hypothetical protein HK097_001259, partial [Rhizophlyctis rosea]